MNYSDTCDEMVKRVLTCFEANPEAVDVDGPFGLFKFKSFKCNDLEPTLAQAGAALAKARQIWRRKQP